MVEFHRAIVISTHQQPRSSLEVNLCVHAHVCVCGEKWHRKGSQLIVLILDLKRPEKWSF